jgi:hypothetical protein
VFGVTWTPGAKLDGHDMVFELIRRINIVFEYSSVYDETFRRCFVEPIRGALWNFTAPVPSLDARAFVSDETACRF